MSATTEAPVAEGGLTTPLKLIAGFVALMLLTVIAMIVVRFMDSGPSLSKANYALHGASAISFLAPYEDNPRVVTVQGDPLAAAVDGTVLLVDSDPGHEVVGIDARSGVQRYSISDIDCSGAATSTLRTGIVECIGSRGADRYLASLDVATGRLLVVTELDQQVSEVVTVAASDQLVVRTLTDGAASLVAYQDGTQVWQRALDHADVVCTAALTAIACDNEEGYEITNLDDGTVQVGWTELASGEGFHLGIDGYAITTDSDARTYLFDFTGANVGSAQTFRVPQYPSRAQGVLYSLADLSQSSPVIAVDGTGSIVVGSDESRIIYAASGDKGDGSVIAVSVDGSQILLSPDGTGVQLVDSNGVGPGHDLGPDAASVSVVDGVITVDKGTSFDLYRAA